MLASKRKVIVWWRLGTHWRGYAELGFDNFVFLFSLRSILLLAVPAYFTAQESGQLLTIQAVTHYIGSFQGHT